MDFTSRYAPPLTILGGGGSGLYGICAMELVNIILGRVDEDGRVEDSCPEVHSDLRQLVISVNDFGFGCVPNETRTEGLWPIVPRLIGTSGHRFPWSVFREILSPGDTELWAWTDHLGYAIRQYAWRQVGRLTGEPISEPIKLQAQTDLYQAAWPHALDALKIALTVHAQVNNLTLQEDYTEDQMERLSDYLAKYPSAAHLDMQSVA